jgi:HEAT repeat protein
VSSRETPFRAAENDSPGPPRSASPEGQSPPRRIRNLLELEEALRAADVALRLDALKAIQTQPKAALAFGVYQGRDVIDILLERAGFAQGSMEWMSWVGALASFHDPRVTDFFIDTITTAESSRLIFSAARYLAEDDPALWSRLLPAFLQNENPVRARAVVSLMERCPSVSAAAGLRTALLSEAAASSAPILDQGNIELWFAELAGPFWREAHIRLKTQGEPAWTALAKVWDRLSETNQLWLLGWGVEEYAGMVAGLLPIALRSSSNTVRIEALRSLALLGETRVPESIAALPVGLLNDPDPEVREAAVLASPAKLDWRAFLIRETVSSVRRACVAQLARSDGDDAILDLIAFLRSDDWQLRTVSAQALIKLGSSAAEAVKPLVHDPDQRVRVAAVRVLLDLQQDKWLEQEFQLSQARTNP